MHPLYAIGDIHGNLEELQDLLGRIRHRAGSTVPHVIMVGDLIDRGPDSRSVVELVMAGIPGVHTHALMGNHEAWLLKALRSDMVFSEWVHSGGADTVEAYGVAIRGRDYMNRFRQAFPDAHRDWLARLPRMLRHGRNLFVHAGIEPEVPLQEQSEDMLLWIRTPFLEWTKPFPEGVRVFHGHTPVPVLEVHEHRINLDSGCGHGGPLSAVAITGDEVVPSDFW